MKRLASVGLLWLGMGLLVGCQSRTPEETVQKPKKTAVPPAPVQKDEVPEKKEPEKPAKEKPSAKGVSELPPAPPTTQELAQEEVKKRGGKAISNKNGDVVEVIWTGPEVTDDHLVLLQKFRLLSKLDLTETSITDAGLKHLRDHEYLRHLFLLGTGVSDAGVPDLQGHSRLERLCLDDTLVTDKGVKFLEPLERLEMLHLATQGDITDASIDSLIKLQNLREIKLEGTKVTEDGKARLVKALPEVEFVGGPDEGIPTEEP